MQWIYSFFFLFSESLKPSDLLLRLPTVPYPLCVAWNASRFGLSQGQRNCSTAKQERKKKEKCEIKKKKGERRTPKADDSRNFDADDDAVILANTNTILHTYIRVVGGMLPSRVAFNYVSKDIRCRANLVDCEPTNRTTGHTYDEAFPPLGNNS